MGYLLFVLFLLAIFNLAAGIVLYLTSILVTFCLSIFIFSKRPDYLNTRTISGTRNVIFIYAIFAFLYLLFRHNIWPLLLSLLGLMPYLYWSIEQRLSSKVEEERKEQRRALRTNLSFEIELRSLADSARYKGLTKDISTSGMRVFSTQSFKKGEKFYFRIYIPEEAWPLTGDAEVVWKKSLPAGFEYGMIFTQISDQDRGKIALTQGFSLLK